MNDVRNEMYNLVTSQNLKKKIVSIMLKVKNRKTLGFSTNEQIPEVGLNMFKVLNVFKPMNAHAITGQEILSDKVMLYVQN